MTCSCDVYLGFCVDSHKFKIGPHFVQEVIIIPFVVSGDGDSVGNLADDVQLLDADLVNLVEDVDAGNVGSVTLHHINKFIRCSITPVEKTIKINPNNILTGLTTNMQHT